MRPGVARASKPAACWPLADRWTFEAHDRIAFTSSGRGHGLCLGRMLPAAVDVRTDRDIVVRSDALLQLLAVTPSIKGRKGRKWNKEFKDIWLRLGWT